MIISTQINICKLFNIIAFVDNSSKIISYLRRIRTLLLFVCFSDCSIYICHV